MLAIDKWRSMVTSQQQWTQDDTNILPPFLIDEISLSIDFHNVTQIFNPIFVVYSIFFTMWEVYVISSSYD